MEKPQAKKSNLRMAIAPISIAIVFFCGFVVKQVFFK
jgi:hypothetical protein